MKDIETIQEGNQIDTILKNWLHPKLINIDIDPNDISNTQDLYEIGAIDSFDIVELVSIVEEKTGLQANFDLSDNEELILSIDKIKKSFIP